MNYIREIEKNIAACFDSIARLEADEQHLGEQNAKLYVKRFFSGSSHNNTLNDKLQLFVEKNKKIEELYAKNHQLIKILKSLRAISMTWASYLAALKGLLTQLQGDTALGPNEIEQLNGLRNRIKEKFIRLSTTYDSLVKKVLILKDEPLSLIDSTLNARLQKPETKISDLASARTEFSAMLNKYTPIFQEMLGVEAEWVKNNSIMLKALYGSGLGFGVGGFSAALMYAIDSSLWMSAVSFLGLTAVHPILAMVILASVMALVFAAVTAIYAFAVNEESIAQPNFNKM
jgi:hypothetical protein